jgi:hypothetical protein
MFEIRTLKSPRRAKKRLAVLSASALGLGSLIGGLAFAAPAGAAANVYVASSGTDVANNCSSAANPCLTLAHAYTQVSSGGTINLAGGTFRGDLVISKNLNIAGTGSTGSLNATTTTISGNSVSTSHTFCLEVEIGSTVTVSNVVLDNATDASVLNLGTLTLNNDFVGAGTNMPPYATAGMFNEGTLTMNGGAASELSSTYIAGALWNETGKSTLNNVALNHDTATGPDAEGGAIFITGGTVRLTGSTALHNNSATLDGGGIERCSGSTLTTTSGVSVTANTPNNISSADPAGQC